MQSQNCWCLLPLCCLHAFHALTVKVCRTVSGREEGPKDTISLPELSRPPWILRHNTSIAFIHTPNFLPDCNTLAVCGKLRRPPRAPTVCGQPERPDGRIDGWEALNYMLTDHRGGHWRRRAKRCLSVQAHLFPPAAPIHQFCLYLSSQTCFCALFLTDNFRMSTK